MTGIIIAGQAQAEAWVADHGKPCHSQRNGSCRDSFNCGEDVEMEVEVEVSFRRLPRPAKGQLLHGPRPTQAPLETPTTSHQQCEPG